MSITVTDLFCGAGGSSSGAEFAGATLKLGLNHWQRAIETHSENFQHADHDCEDVSSLTTAQIRRYPDSDILLASPECTNHSLAKGARRRKPQAASLFSDGPAGDAEQDRSRATMWDVVRFAEQKLLKGKPYKAIVVENVVDAFNWGPNDDGALFDLWVQAVDAIGYHHEVVWLNSMFAGAVPQSRDRMYVVFWRKGMRTPDLRFEPLGWCPACEKVTHGVQSFKKQRRGRNWGRYGPQYVFRCNDCAGVIFPGAHPAELAIDWTIPAKLIGERDRPLAKATRERIRRGLERLACEPFAIRLLQSGNPKPLTLPLVTMTARHDMAMVVPAGGTWSERATDIQAEPLATQTGTESKALVLTNLANNVPRKASEEPTPPILPTGAHQAVVVPNEKNTTPRRTDEDPVHTVKAGGQHHMLVMRTGHKSANGNLTRDAEREPMLAQTTHAEQAIVMRNNKGGGEMSTPADSEPIRTLTSGCHQSLVVPHSTDGVPKLSGEQPIDTVSTQNKVALVVPYDSTGRARLADEEPANTLTTKDRAAIVETFGDDDIDACRFRMFDLPEIARAMAMHAHPGGGEYVVLGNKRERMAQYGNGVTPPAMEAIVGRLLEVVA